MRFTLLVGLLVWFPVLPPIAVAQKHTQLREKRLQRSGIRKIEGKHLQLFTDLPPAPQVDELPRVFDAAVPLWLEYFRVPAKRVQGWQVRGYLIQDRAKFAALDLLPRQWPEFPNGFATPQEVWVMEQPSAYYRRHLLLHEGTHAFMNSLLGGTGPGWYMEGMAELFGTHSWENGKLRMRTMPQDKQSVPMWGRVKLIREAYQAGEALDLEPVLKMDGHRAMSTGQYAWCWALCKFLDSHPQWQDKFRQLPRHVTKRRFNEVFRRLNRSHWSDLLLEWRVFVADLDYGYDARRMPPQHRPAQPLRNKASVEVLADRGWQSTGWVLQHGIKYEITATGRYIIAEKKAPWPCEPGGVTIEYHDGHPLGKLMGAWRTKDNTLSEPFSIGLRATITPPRDAVLYFRVNDSPAARFDNRGSLTASILIQDSQAD